MCTTCDLTEHHVLPLHAVLQGDGLQPMEARGQLSPPGAESMTLGWDS